MASPTKPPVKRPTATALNERLVAATLQLLRDEIPTDLTVRRIATAAGTTTMALYTGFGSRDGLLDVVYAQGFERLRERMAPAAGVADPAQAILEMLEAYRAFALANPGLYGLLFERVLPGFDPSPEARVRSGHRLRSARDPGWAVAGNRRTRGVLKAGVHALGADPRPCEPGAVARQPESVGSPRACRDRWAKRSRHGPAGDAGRLEQARLADLGCGR